VAKLDPARVEDLLAAHAIVMGGLSPMQGGSEKAE
jgi:hypothetical protein